MDTDGLRSISEFGWASVTQYIVWVSGAAELKELNAGYVYSFPMAMIGAKKLERIKRATLLVIQGNMKQLERFVGKHRETLEKPELSVIRGMYRSLKDSEEIVLKHIEALEKYVQLSAKLWDEDEEKGGQDDLPF